jgi:hypothetical protein
MVCDVENKVGGVPPDSLRKSDLVVLDYNLGPTADDNERAIRILRSLAETKHFNMIVVYTSEPDQDRVWLETAASLVGGWTAGMPALTAEAQGHWDRLADAQTLPDPSREALLAVVANDMRSMPADARAALNAELAAAGVEKPHQSDIVKGLMFRALGRLAGDHAASPRTLVRGRRSAAGPRWLQCRNCFVAILQKTDLQNENVDDPAGIMACLSSALLDWRPNLFQIVISEMQNILELEALVTEDEHLRDAVTQTALWYYLLDSLGQTDLTGAELAHAPLANVVDKIVDGLRRRLSSDPGLLEMASKAMIDEMTPGGLTATRPARATKELYDLAHTLARPPQQVTQREVMFRLNSFLCAEPFRRSSLTTGTVFKDFELDTFWVAASPACDMVPRKPGSHQKWATNLHPTTSLVTLQIEAVSLEPALRDAENGQNIFLEIGAEKKVFRILDSNTGQPSVEVMFPANEGRVSVTNGTVEFTASRVTHGDTPADRTLALCRFKVVGQLRPTNANRLLQLAGQHLSRIGMDFLNMSPEPPPKSNLDTIKPEHPSLVMSRIKARNTKPELKVRRTIARASVIGTRPP